MLTVAKIAGLGAAAYGQYLEGRTVAAEAGDYYLSQSGERVEAPGRWALGARGAETLGVDAAGPVGAEQFRALMAVQNPATGGRLRAGGAGGSAVAAIDATFSAPKSVSVVWALGSPELRAQLEAAQERAVDAALAHATEYVPMVRRRVDRETVLRETPSELIATSWRHTTARGVAGRAPDPQLHSHVVLHGAVRQGDGRVVAIESRAWLVHQRELGAAYRAQLADELGELGFQITAGTVGVAATSNCQGSLRASWRSGQGVTVRSGPRLTSGSQNASQSSRGRSTRVGPALTPPLGAWRRLSARGSCCPQSSGRWR